MKIILGSTSKSRLEILEKLGYEVGVRKPEIDEKAIRCKNPTELTLALANAKSKKLQSWIDEPAILITADQVVLVDRQVREKPESIEEARTFLKSYAHQSVQTITSVVVYNTKTGAHSEGTDVATIWFRPIDDQTIDALIQKGEIMSCCGGFKAEDPLLKPFIMRLEGTMESIMGMPPELTKRLIEEVRNVTW